METLGRYVTTRREQLELRPEHLAIALNVSVATIYNLENDKYIPRADRLIPLAKVLKVEPVKLLELLEEATEKSESEYRGAEAALV